MRIPRKLIIFEGAEHKRSCILKDTSGESRPDLISRAVGKLWCGEYGWSPRPHGSIHLEPIGNAETTTQIESDFVVIFIDL